jgi:hypothetical protein
MDDASPPRIIGDDWFPAGGQLHGGRWPEKAPAAHHPDVWQAYLMLAA